jgi:hypothetical protein
MCYIGPDEYCLGHFCIYIYFFKIKKEIPAVEFSTDTAQTCIYLPFSLCIVYIYYTLYEGLFK